MYMSRENEAQYNPNSTKWRSVTDFLFQPLWPWTKRLGNQRDGIWTQRQRENMYRKSNPCQPGVAIHDVTELSRLNASLCNRVFIITASLSIEIETFKWKLGPWIVARISCLYLQEGQMSSIKTTKTQLAGNCINSIPKLKRENKR